MSASGRAAEALVEAIDYPLYVVTASAGDEVSGCLAGFVTQCSIEPVCFAVCVSKVNHTFGVAQRSAGLAVHLIGADQRDLASLFGEESGDWMDKFTRVDWSPGVTGAPLLSDCGAWVEGPVVGTLSGGDHQVFVIEVIAGGAGSHAGSFTFADAAELEAGHPGDTSESGP